jgi:hypothetical protein
MKKIRFTSLFLLVAILATMLIAAAPAPLVQTEDICAGHAGETIMVKTGGWWFFTTYAPYHCPATEYQPPQSTAAAPEEPAYGSPSDGGPATCTFAVSGSVDNMKSYLIKKAPLNQWFHRLFNETLFNAGNDWGGADSWFVSLALGSNSGGSWVSQGNPGQIQYRAISTSIRWCLGVLTSSKYKSQFLQGANKGSAAINVRIAPNSIVTVVTKSGKTISQATSDMGDITIVLPDSGVVTIAVDYTTAAPTHESMVWWGPYDRSQYINTIDAR